MFAFVLALAAQVTVALPAGWKTYNNLQAGYTSCYPTGMQQIRESTDEGGTSFFSSGGGVSFSSYIQSNRTLIQHTKTPKDESVSVDHRLVGNDWIIETGYQFGNPMWRKSFKRGNRFVSIWINEENPARYRAMVSIMNACTIVR